MAEHETGFFFTAGGQDSARRPELLPENKYTRGVNVAVWNGMPGTRYAVRVLPLSGDAAAFFQAENFQGGQRYSPGEGQGAVSVGKDESSLLLAVGGRKLNVRLTGAGMGTGATVTDVSAGVVSNPDFHLVYWSQWENYALAGDANSNTWIWDGVNPAFASDGYSITDRPSSKVPNGAGPMAYVHGRGVVCVNSRALLVGNLLNSQDLTTAKDVLRFDESTYNATSQYFSPPTRLGPIMALAYLPVKDTAHGHGELFAHEWNGIFSVDLNVFPRARWSDTPMVKIAHIGSGATGPYAVDIYDGDQIFRSRVGVQTLRSARAQNTRAGAPQHSIAQGVRPFLHADPPRLLRFASVKTWEVETRAFVTCSPVVRGRRRWHRGFVAANFDPISDESAPAMWEGLWTLPPEIGGVIQFIGGDFDSEDRIFAICHSVLDGKNRIVEIRRDIDDDVLDDGKRRRIRSQLVTRKLIAMKPLVKKNWATGTLFFSDVRGRVDWGVWIRHSGSRKWIYWRGGYIENCAACRDTCDLSEPAPWEGEICIGTIEHLKECFQKTARNVQVLIRWAGRCCVDAFRISHTGGDPDEDRMDKAKFKIVVSKCDGTSPEYSDFEYLEKTEAECWLSEIKTCP